MFFKYQQNETKIASYEILDASFDDLKNELGLELNEALEMFCKFQLAKNGHCSLDHFSNCGVCRNPNISLLLTEYGATMSDDEKKEISEKTNGWAGYYLILESRKIIQLLNLSPALRPKVMEALRQLNARHKI